MTQDEIRITMQNNDLIMRSWPIFCGYLGDGLTAETAIEKTAQAIEAWKGYRDAHLINLDPTALRDFMVASGDFPNLNAINEAMKTTMGGLSARTIRIPASGPEPAEFPRIPDED